MSEGTFWQAPGRGALFVGSYPPRECGIATFTRDIVESFRLQSGQPVSVIAIDEPGGEERTYPRDVIGRLHRNVRASYRHVAALIDRHPAPLICVQHEYGLFGGEDGAWFLDLLESVRKPVVVALHTVLPEPSAHHRAIAQAICRRAAAVVVLSQTGKDVLVTTYGADPAKISVIPHGVPDVEFVLPDVAKPELGLAGRLVVSTFGLISRGKGLEYAIDAIRLVANEHPSALYLVIGQTHPEVRRTEGESYRESLTQRIADLRLRDHVRFIDRYLSLPELLAYLRASDVYLTPYLNAAQIVSGTLAYAVGAGKAIVATPYLYARELLAHRRGLLAEFRDAPSMAQAIAELFDDDRARHAMERRAYRYGRRMTWPHVAAAYARLFATTRPPAPLMLPASA